MPSELEPHLGLYDWDEAFRQGEEIHGLPPYAIPDDIRKREF
jgi:hypothetical protein